MSKRKATSKNKEIKNQLSLDLGTPVTVRIALTNNLKSARLSVVVSNFWFPNTSAIP